jgi:hypothetical protein
MLFNAAPSKAITPQSFEALEGADRLNQVEARVKINFTAIIFIFLRPLARKTPRIE